MNFLKKTWFKNFERDKRYARLNIFKDSELQGELELLGYARGGVVLNGKQIADLKNIFVNFLTMIGGKLPDTFMGSGLIRDSTAKSYILNSVFEITQPIVAQFLNTDVAQPQPGSMQIKPPTQTSQLSLHQDNAFVDEEKYMGIYTWIPLTDVTGENGWMYMIPGSHRFGNVHRSLNLPWQFKDMDDVLMKYAKFVPAKAGEIIFFDSGTIHGSTPNHSKEVRLAVTTVITPLGSEIINIFKDETTPPGMVEYFEVNEDFWNNYDFMRRPPSKFKFLGDRKYHDLKMTKRKLKNLCNKYS